ncbi:MAG: MucR family transcriptional regulator [Pseudomonadota bacterium]
MQSQVTTSELLSLTTEIVASYVSNSNVEAADLPTFVQKVYASLTDLATGKAYSASRPEPAVSIKKSIAEDYIICLEDGKKLKMLKRHLKSAYNMTPEQYRERWGLAPDYPMVAPSYARQRSELAKTIGLGTKRRKGGRGMEKAA